MQNQINNVTTYKVLAEVLGVLEELCAEMQIPYETVVASSWKSGLGIKGRDRASQKKAAQVFVEQTYGKKVSSDEADSVCIGTNYINKNKSAW